MFFKRKKKLFGNEIETNCSYCSHNGGSEDMPNCSKGVGPERDGSCRHFVYDPLMRTPRSLPPLREYDADDFSL